MDKLSPYARLILARLEIQPNQTLDELMASTGCDRRATTRETLRWLMATGQVKQEDSSPTRYRVPVDEELSKLQALILCHDDRYRTLAETVQLILDNPGAYPLAQAIHALDDMRRRGMFELLTPIPIEDDPRVRRFLAGL